jgi:hypothetical protein
VILAGVLAVAACSGPTGAPASKDAPAAAASVEDEAKASAAEPGDATGNIAVAPAEGADAAEEPELYPEEDNVALSLPVEQTGPQERPDILQPRTRPDDQLLILEVRLRDLILSDGMFGYLDEGGLLLPLSDFVRLLEFPIAVDPANGRANGWYLEEGRLFSLDILSGQIAIDGRKRRFNRQLVEIQEDDIYVDARLLADWFPVDIDFDLGNLVVTMESREPLPMEQRLTREIRRSKAMGRKARRKDSFPEHEAPYAWADWPMLNLNAQAGYNRDAAGLTDVSGGYGLLATGDLLKHSASLFVGGNQDRGVSDVRFQMGRKDPDGEMLGFMRVTQYSLGDIVTPSVELIANPRFGRGAEMSSFPLARTGKFSSTTLIGELPLGWEVELYRNGILLDFRASREDGRYEFSEVPLLFGLNILQLQFFGPQGQYREETQRVLVGPGQVPPGRLNFRIAASQQDERLVPLDSSETLSLSDQQLLAEPRGSLELEYGASKYVSLAASAVSVPLINGRKSYGGLGLRFGVRGLYGRLDVVRDSEGGLAGKLGTQFNLPLNLVLLAEQGIYNDFSSEEIQDDGDLPVSTTEGRLDGVVPLWQGRRLPFSFAGAYEKSESGASSLELSNRLSLALGRLSVSNNIQWRQFRTALDTTTSSSGNFLMGGRAWGVGIRGEVGYAIEPESELVSAAVNGEWLFGSGFSARLGVAHGFGAGVTTMSGGISRIFDSFSLGFTGSYSDDGSASALLTFGLSAARDPHSRDWSLHGGDVASKGAVSARVFVDNDFDGKFSDGDDPVEGAIFETGQSLATEETGQDGIAMLTGLPPNKDMPISVPPSGLDDPYWIPEPEGYVVPLRPGAVATLDFPIVVTGEVDGTVALRRLDSLIAVSDVVVQLVNQEGEVISQTRSSFDGFYLLEMVRPGTYTVRVDPDQMRRLGLVGPPPELVEINGDGTIVSGLDLLIGSAI